MIPPPMKRIRPQGKVGARCFAVGHQTKETSFFFLALLHSHVQKITHEDPGPAESGLDGDASHLEAELLNAIWRHPSVQNCSHLRYFCRGPADAEPCFGDGGTGAEPAKARQDGGLLGRGGELATEINPSNAQLWLLRAHGKRRRALQVFRRGLR
jgi:hypothetical protein